MQAQVPVLVASLLFKAPFFSWKEVFSIQKCWNSHRITGWAGYALGSGSTTTQIFDLCVLQQQKTPKNNNAAFRHCN